MSNDNATTETAPPSCAPSNHSPASFARVEIRWPGFHLEFVATSERIHRLMSLLVPEVLAAELEFKASKAKQENSGVAG